MVQSGTEAGNPAGALAIEQEVAKELLLIYQKKRSFTGRKFGGRKLELEIYKALGRDTQLFITREDIDKWLIGRTKSLGAEKFKAVKSFMATAHFAEFVPQVTAILDPLKTTKDVGCALSQVYGYGGDADLSYLDGLWLITRKDREAGLIHDGYQLLSLMMDLNHDYAFMYIKSLTGFDFSIVHFIRGDSPPHFLPALRASGFIFQKDRDTIVRVWNRANREESIYNVTCEIDPRNPTGTPNRFERHKLSVVRKEVDEGHKHKKIADNVLSHICNPVTVLQPFKQSPYSSEPYFAYNCILMPHPAVFDQSFDMQVNAEEKARLLKHIQSKFDSFLWSVIPNGNTKES